MVSLVSRAHFDTTFFGIETERIGKLCPLSGCGDPKTGIESRAMSESIYEYVLEELQSAKGHWRLVAEGSEVSIRTIEKIARQEIADPGVSHIEKLAKYFKSAKRRRDYAAPNPC
jgi:hypothetical protein